MRILIAEDEKISRELMEKMLSPYGACTGAENGKKAIDEFYAAWARNEPYDLVCLDIMMPEMDGHAVLAGIRAYEREHGIEEGGKRARVIMTTCLDDRENFLKALDRGSEWYITKPIDRTRLVEILKDLGLVEMQ